MRSSTSTSASTRSGFPGLLLAALVLAAFLAVPVSAAGVSAWGTLDSLRSSLVDGGATKASFSQTYVPSGFSSGETERGTMYLALPDCMRWDYTEPYQKTFLLCGDTAHYWNPEDRSGRRYEVDREEEPGLDLLMLSTDTLRERYRATAQEGGGGTVRVTLVPLDEAGSLAEATLTVDPGAGRLTALAYRDREGNRTTFDIGESQALSGHGRLFEAPEGIRWESGTP